MNRWICNFCQFANLQNCSHCDKCNKSKYDTSYRQQRKSDWMCPVCNFKVFGSKSECFKCKTKRDDVVFTAVNQFRPPDAGAGERYRQMVATQIQPPPASSSSSSATPAPSSLTSFYAGSECLVCMTNDHPKQALSCGHVYCQDCITTLRSQAQPCPICKHPITTVTRLYNI